MKTTRYELPPGNPKTVLLRYTPEDDKDRKWIKDTVKSLKGTSAVVTTPKIDGEIVLSIMHNYAQANKAQKTKA